jgi:hypothetical protein
LDLFDIDYLCASWPSDFTHLIPWKIKKVVIAQFILFKTLPAIVYMSCERFLSTRSRFG